MPQGSTTRVKGYREFIAASRRGPKDTKVAVYAAFRQVGDVVKRGVQQRLLSLDTESAAGVRTVVSQAGVRVLQSHPKVTGKRPDFGALQMRDYFLPEAQEQQPAVEREMEKAIDHVGDLFESRPPGPR